MKSEYDINTLKCKGHPLREKIVKGDIKLIDPFDISDEEFNEKISALSLDEQEFAINIRNEKYIKMI
jgi:hypothetical protein